MGQHLPQLHSDYPGYLTVIGADEGTVDVDVTATTMTYGGVGVPIFTDGDTGFGIYRTAVGDGAHTLTSDQGVGVMVYGYDNDVSYGYPAGMKLDKL